jgi:hypothetical protein
VFVEIPLAFFSGAVIDCDAPGVELDSEFGVPLAAAIFARNTSAARLHLSTMRWQSANPCMVKLALVR